jgi:hypothetical protein
MQSTTCIRPSAEWFCGVCVVAGSTGEVANVQLLLACLFLPRPRLPAANAAAASLCCSHPPWICTCLAAE